MNGKFSIRSIRFVACFAHHRHGLVVADVVSVTFSGVSLGVDHLHGEIDRDWLKPRQKRKQKGKKRAANVRDRRCDSRRRNELQVGGGGGVVEDER